MISLLWPWPDPPAAVEGLPRVEILHAAGEGAALSQARRLAGACRGERILLPAGGDPGDLRDAVALATAARADAALAGFLPRSARLPEPVLVARDAWEPLAAVLGEQEPARLLVLLREAWRLGLSVDLRVGPARADTPAAGLAAHRALLAAVASLPDPGRRPLLALAIAEVLAGGATSPAGLAARFRFGAPVAQLRLEDLGEATFLALLAVDELARDLPRAAPAGACPVDAALLPRLIPGGGLSREARAALEEILGLTPAGQAPAPAPPSPASDGGPRFSVIIPTLDAADLLRDCLASLRDVEAAAIRDGRLEAIVVDNASRDGTADVVAAFPFARRLALPENLGFAGPCNAGAAAARGSVIVLLNNDTVVEPGWLAGLAATLDGGAAGAASLVLSASGREVDFGGGGINFEGKGLQDGFGDTDVAAWSGPAPLLFGNGASVAFRRDAWQKHGGFDDAFFAYYEDVDLGVRLALAGDAVVRAGASRVRHRHNATSRRFPAIQKAFHMERNALRVVLKAYGPDALSRILPAALLLLVRRGFLRARCDGAAILGPEGIRPEALEEHRSGDAGAAVGWQELAVAAAAVGEVLGGLPELLPRRRAAQALRRVPDGELVARAGHFTEAAPVPDREGYGALQGRLLQDLGVVELAARGVRRRVLLVTHEDLTTNLAGPAIRVLEMARVLAREHDVAVAAPRVDPALVPPEGVRVAAYDRWEEPTLLGLARDRDVLVVQGHTLQRYRSLTRTGAAIVADLYCPFPLENLELSRGRRGEDALGSFEGDLEALDVKLVAGDFFLAASEKQRDLWLGALLHAGRINPLTHADDPRLERLVSVVPFGIPAEPPVRRGPGAKGAIAGIGAQDRLLLWGGSLVDWQDPLTVIRAMARVAARHSDVKLLFMGVSHPTPGVKPMAVLERSRDLARSLGLLDTHVFFHPWVPYAERGAVLLDADVAVLAHQVHVETRFSFRTRMLDVIWAAVPPVITEGDTFADLVSREGLGLVVPPGDADAFARAVLRLLDEPELHAACRERLRGMAPRFSWEEAMRPLSARLPGLEPAPDRAWLRQRGWRRALMRYGAGGMLDTARRRIPAPVRRTLKRILRMGR